MLVNGDLLVNTALLNCDRLDVKQTHVQNFKKTCLYFIYICLTSHTKSKLKSSKNTFLGHFLLANNK